MKRILKNCLWLFPIHLALLFFTAMMYVLALKEALNIKTNDEPMFAYGFAFAFAMMASAFLALVFALIGAIINPFGGKIKKFFKDRQSFDTVKVEVSANEVVLKREIYEPGADASETRKRLYFFFYDNAIVFAGYLIFGVLFVILMILMMVLLS